MDTPTIDTRPPTLKVAGVEFYPVARDRLPELRALLVELTSRWIEAKFSTGEVVADPVSWATMQRLINLLPRVDNPAVAGVDLSPLANHYLELERIFFSQGFEAKPEDLHGWSIFTFDLEKYKGAKLTELHRLNPRLIVTAADGLRVERQSKAGLNTEGGAVTPEVSNDAGASVAGQETDDGG